MKGTLSHFGELLWVAAGMVDLSTAPPPPQKFPCVTCARIFFDAPSLKAHSRQCPRPRQRTRSRMCHVRAQLYMCKICNNGFSCQGDLRTHALVHAHKPAICPECKRTYTSVGYLRRHQLVQRCGTPIDDDIFECRECKHEFQHARSLARHIKLLHPTY